MDKVEWDGEFGKREIGELEDLSVPPRCRIYLPVDISLLHRIYISNWQHHGYTSYNSPLTLGVLKQND